MIGAEVARFDVQILEIRDDVRVHDYFVIPVGGFPYTALAVFQPEFQDFMEFQAAVIDNALFLQLRNDLLHPLDCLAFVSFFRQTGGDPPLLRFTIRSDQIEHRVIVTLFNLY